VNAKINLEKMDLFLSDKQIDITDSMEEHAIAIKKVAWQERDKALWAGMNLVIFFDELPDSGCERVLRVRCSTACLSALSKTTKEHCNSRERDRR
jgi:hypothetical protein